jgi:hypothetical protein
MVAKRTYIPIPIGSPAGKRIEHSVQAVAHLDAHLRC